MQSVAATYGLVLTAFFAVGGAAIGIASTVAAQPRKLWALLGLEALQVAGIVVPAALGGPWLVVAYLLLALACLRELVACLRAGRVTIGLALMAAVLWVGGGFAALTWLGLHSFAALAFVYTVVEANDTLAWAVGSAIGKHKLAPRLSPNKTWEGLIGGFTGTVAVACALGFLLPMWSLVQCAAAGLLLAVVGTAGDLLASWCKRRAGWRSFAELVPYQGGVFDLYDSIVFAAPWFCLLTRWWAA